MDTLCIPTKKQNISRWFLLRKTSFAPNNGFDPRQRNPQPDKQMTGARWQLFPSSPSPSDSRTFKKQAAQVKCSKGQTRAARDARFNRTADHAYFQRCFSSLARRGQPKSDTRPAMVWTSTVRAMTATLVCLHRRLFFRL